METVEELLFRLHINADEMNQQFVQVSRTLNENLARINRERNLINVQTQVDLQGLDRATNATQIFEIRQRSLQRQIENQRARLELLNVVLRDTRERTGEDSDATQRAQLQYEQARLSVRRLETQLERLNRTQDQTTSSTNRWVELYESIVNSGMFLRGLESIQNVMAAIGEETTRLIERFKEVEKQAYELNMPFQQTRDILLKVRLAGGDIGDFEGFIRGLTDAYVKGEVDDPEAIALNKYDAQIMDEKGRLKDFESITKEVYQAYKKAKAAGEEIEFLQLVGGESGIRDAIQFFERYEEATQDTGRIFKSGIDPAEMHQAERSIALLTEQLSELHDEVANLFTPAVINAADDFFEILKASTQFVQENKDAIKNIGGIAYDNFIPIFSQLKTLKNIFFGTDESAEALAGSVSNLNEVLDKASDGNTLSQYGIQRVQQFRDELEDLRIELDYEDEFEQRLAELDLWRQRELTNKLYVSKDERAAIEQLYSAKLEAIERDRADSIQKIEKDSAERTKALMKETADISFTATHSAYEKEVRDIQDWARASITALSEYQDAVKDKNQIVEEAVAITANAMAKEAEAFEKEMDRIKGKTQSLAEKIFEQENSRRDIDIMKAQKERAELYAEGIYDPKMIERWFKNRMGEITDNVFEDTSGRYTKKPKHRQQQQGDYPIIYGDQPTMPSLPKKDFYAEIQAQVDQAINAQGTAGYELQRQHENLQTALSVPVDKFSQSVQQFSEIPQQFLSIEDRVQSRTPNNNITVSPNINVDLGGAYVFDNHMKKQLTDDITNEVVDAVKSAFQTATRSSNFSYGN